MDIERFMRGYKAAWEARDESRFCALFTRLTQALLYGCRLTHSTTTSLIWITGERSV